jgi:hypothetical protein
MNLSKILKLSSFSIGASLILCIIVVAQSVGGGAWTFGYDDDEIYSTYTHNTKWHGASTAVCTTNGEDYSSADRDCKGPGVTAESRQIDRYRHKKNHGHAYWHRCKEDISNCSGASNVE